MDFVIHMGFRACISYISTAYCYSSVICYFFQLSPSYCIKLIGCFAELTDRGLKKYPKHLSLPKIWLIALLKFGSLFPLALQYLGLLLQAPRANAKCL